MGIKVDKPSARDRIIFRKKKTIKKRRRSPSTSLNLNDSLKRPSLPNVIKRMVKEAVVPRASVITRRKSM